MGCLSEQGALAGERSSAWAAAIAARWSIVRACHPDCSLTRVRMSNQNLLQATWDRKQENCEPHVSKESHTFLTNNISFRALKAIAIRYHTPLSGHAIFFIFLIIRLHIHVSLAEKSTWLRTRWSGVRIPLLSINSAPFSKYKSCNGSFFI